MVLALGALAGVAAYLTMAEPQGPAWGAVAVLGSAVAVVLLGALRAYADVVARHDLARADKKIWILWIWMAAPLTVPLYLRRRHL